MLLGWLGREGVAGERRERDGDKLFGRTPWAYAEGSGVSFVMLDESRSCNGLTPYDLLVLILCRSAIQFNVTHDDELCSCSNRQVL